MKLTNKQWTYTGIILIASLVAGSLAGIVSSIFTNRSMENYMQIISNEEIILSLSQVKPDPIPGTYEEALSDVYDSYDSLAFAYLQTETSVLESDWIYESDALGVGVIVTSDGWVLFESQVLSGLDADEISLFINGEWYKTLEIVEDTRSSVVLVKVDAGGFDAVTFGSSELTESGEIIFILKNNSALFVSSLADAQYHIQDTSLPAEDYVVFWKVQDEMGGSLPIFDSSGHVIGFTSEGVDAIPFYHFEQFIESVLEHGTPEYAAVGAYVLDIERAVNLDTDSLSTEHGFMVVQPDSYSRAVYYGGPAHDADLEEYDVIVSVDNVDLSSEYSLAKVLSRYSTDQVITLGIMREGEYVEKVVTLENYDLLY